MGDTHAIHHQSRFSISSTFMFRWEESQEAYVLMYPEGIVKLNQTAGEILNYCDGQHAVADIVARLGAMFNEDTAFLHERVVDFLEVCRAKGWIHTES